MASKKRKITNREVSDTLDEFARILELKNANPFKIRAFENAARSVQSLSKNLENIYTSGGVDALKELDGIGDSISKLIAEYYETGEMEELEGLKEEIPVGLLDMIQIEGLGPKSVTKLHKNLGISSIEELEKAAKSGEIAKLSGFGKKSVENILDGIDRFRRSHERSLRMKVQPEANQLTEQLKEQFKQINQIEIAGSMRRKRSTVGDVDILIQAPAASTDDIMSYIREMAEVDRVLVSGDKKTSILTKTNLQIDFRVIDSKREYAAHLQYFTGSKEHNIAVRKIAIDKGLKLNEYGLQQENEEYLNLQSEAEIYDQLGLQFVVPELREDRGEIELAKNHELPNLITKEQVHADFHVHTLWSEGNNSIREMAEEAKSRGLSYLVFTDHTQDLVIANGMDEMKIKDQIEEIRSVNDELEGIELFCGAELNIRNNGNVDLDDETLEMLDFAIASIHSGFKQSAEKITDRIIKAMEQPKVKVIAHPTGRQVNRRDPYEINLDRIVNQAIDHNVALEINGSERQDLSDVIIHSLRTSDVKFSLGSDAHSTGQLQNLDYAIDLARRGWVTPDRLLNTMKVDEFKQYFDIN